MARAERYLKVDVDARGARVVVSLSLGPGETTRVLATADADEDGTVTQAEADAYMAQWGAGLLTDLPIEVDGAPAEVRWGEPFLDPVGPIRGVPSTYEMVARVPLAGGRHRVTLVDHMRLETFDRTDVAFTTQPPVRLLASGPGLQPVEVVPRLAYGGGADPVERLTAVVEMPAPPRDDRALYAAMGIAVFVLGALGWMGTRRKR